MQRALRERREGAHGLDLVPEELDAQRLPPRGREDVDEAAADRELAAVVDPLDALVAREREFLRELLEAELDARSEHDRRRALLGGRHPLRERRRRGEDEPACGEDVERPRPLADEVRRRLEPRLPPHAAARQQRDALRPEEPAGRLGEIPRVAVVRDEHDGLLPARLVQRGEDEREHGLGDPRTLGQRLDIRVEALGAEELLDERVENRAVHRCARDRAVSRPTSLARDLVLLGRVPRWIRCRVAGRNRPTSTPPTLTGWGTSLGADHARDRAESVTFLRPPSERR